MDLHDELYERILMGCTPMADGDVAISAKFDLIPDGGFDLNKLMPPTYKGEGKTVLHHFEDRYLNQDEKKVEIVVLDQPQSTANRIEKAAMNAQKAGLIQLSDILVHCEGADKTLSAMETNHRAYSAIHQASTLDNVPFVNSELGKVLFGEDLSAAMKAMVENNVLSMVLGCWASHIGHARALKFPRLILNEVIAGVVSKTKKSASCSDPLGIENVLDIEMQDAKCKPWRISESGMKSIGQPFTGTKSKKEKDEPIESADDSADDDVERKTKTGKFKKIKPSQAGLGNGTVPNIYDGGVSVEWVKDIFTLSLRRTLRYETDNFEEIGTSIKSFNNIPDLESYVIEIVNDFNSFKFHQNKKSNYVEILSESPSKTFLELLTEIDKRKSKKNI